LSEDFENIKDILHSLALTADPLSNNVEQISAIPPNILQQIATNAALLEEIKINTSTRDVFKRMANNRLIF
jgi:hypothetical protein